MSTSFEASPWVHERGRSTEDFWQLVDGLQIVTERAADAIFAPFAQMDLGTLRRALVQYRFFTIHYIQDLATLVAKTPFGKVRSLLASILSEELGSGDPEQAHPRLYDDFLASIGVQEGELERGEPRNLRLLERIRDEVIAMPFAVGIGLRGLGGECLCQRYLDRLYHHLIRNPLLQQASDQIDWRFWEIHVGPLDIHHREQTRAVINELLSTDPTICDQIADGFLNSIKVWDEFWRNISTLRGEPAPLSQFHLAFPVRDLEEARAFYVGVVGCTEGRATWNHIDLNMFGHHVVAHLVLDRPAAAAPSEFDGREVPVPHFGVNLSWDDWERLAERLDRRGARFRDRPHVRMKGRVGEHATLFVFDPSGNALEFKAFRDPSQVFAIDPNDVDHGRPIPQA